jgi:DNA polymerase V
MIERTYMAIDLKSFYASVECVERGLDPLTANLVVADSSRTEKTICLAVSPSLKAYGIPGRARLFEVIQKAKEINVEFITAPPRMRKYIEYSSRIYDIYLKYISSDDIHVYSIDEVFIDVTDYLPYYKTSARELAMDIINEILKQTGITATCGIGTNLYLCKIAMDIVAKHIPPDKNGVRIAELDEHKYRKLLWTHEPITDFWRIGRGIAKRLAKYQIYTMGDIARCSIGKKTDFYNEDLLYRILGVNAELLIDHAWGWEPATIESIKSYIPESNSISSGQVLFEPYTYEKAKIVLREMLELLSLDLVSKHLTTDRIVLYIGYDISNLTDKNIAADYHGSVVTDHYGRRIPKPVNGSVNLGSYTSSAKIIINNSLRMFDEIIDRRLFIRRINISAENILPERLAEEKKTYRQLSIFDTIETDTKEKILQETMLKIQQKYGKNSILKAASLQEGATTMLRNEQIGGHHS